MSKEQMIHDAAMKIMGEVGVKIHNAKAIGILEENGIRIEDETAFFTEEQVMHWVRMAPSSFDIYARNPVYNVHIGDGQVNPAATYGCAFIDDWDGTRRRGTMDDYIKCLKLIQAEDSYSINGGILIQPSDVPEDYATVEMFYAGLTHSNKAIMLPTGYKREMELIMEASCELFGGKDALVEKPRMVALINTVSPLSLDERMLDCLMILAEHGQPAVLCPASMLGATSPISMAATLASNTAEDLAGIALAQMIRPGTPVIFGIQSTAADFKHISFACAAPEGTVLQGYAAKMGAFYGLPSRGGGCQTDAPQINCQAGYESMLTLSSAYRHGINLVMEAGGVMDSVNATSFEKMVVDFEIIRQVKVAFAPVEVDDETLGLDVIAQIGHDGSFVMSESTLENYGELYSPHVGERGAKDPDYFKASIDREMQRLLDAYASNPPQLDAEASAKVRAVLERSGADAAELERIETL